MKKYLPFIVGVLLVAIDQIVKWWVEKNPSFLYLNRNFIFGMGENWDLFFWIAMILILVLAFITFFDKKTFYWPFCLMLAGAVSNLLDRLTKGGVIDYFKINFHLNLNFNIADILLIFGLIFYFLEAYKENGKISR